MIRGYIVSLLLLSITNVYGENFYTDSKNEDILSKKLEKVFKYALNGDNTKAINEREKIEQLFLDNRILRSKYKTLDTMLFPLWQLSECLLLIDKDPWKAYEIFKKNTQYGSTNQYADIFLSKRGIRSSLQSIEDMIDLSLIEFVSKSGKEEEYDKLISILINYDGIDQIINQQEQIAFDKVCSSEDYSECNRYLEKYGFQNESHYIYVENRRDSLAYIHILPTVNDCKRYLSSFPSSKYSSQVKALEEGYAYDEIKKNVTIDNINSFLREYSQSKYVGAVRNLLQEAISRKYCSKDFQIKELVNFISNESIPEPISSKLIKFYSNNIYLPTSSYMRESRILTGTIVQTSLKDGIENKEIISYNNQGLLVFHSNTKSGHKIQYYYKYIADKGFEYDSKIDERGKVVKYSTSYNNGRISEIIGSDGSKIVYSYQDNTLKSITHYFADKVLYVDYYDVHKYCTTRNDIQISYEYNSMGDVVSLTKTNNNVVLEKTTYSYEYDEGGEWILMKQYNDGTLFITKTRSTD